MDLASDDDGQGGSAEQSVSLHVPSGLPEQGVTRGGEARQIGHRRAGDNRSARFRAAAQDVPHPLERNILECGGRRRHDPQRRILIPR